MRISRTVALAVALAVAMPIAGCSLQPPYRRPETPVASSFPAPGPTDPAVGESLAAAEIGWRDFLVDARLLRLTDIALQNNRDLRVAMLNVAKVKAQYRVQDAARYPQVMLGVTGTQARTAASLQPPGRPLVAHSSAVEIDVAWEIDFFGRLRSLSDSAFQQHLASTHARQAAEILLVSQVADQYLAGLGLNDQLAITRKTLDAADHSHKILRSRLEVGTASELDVIQAETLVEQAKSREAEQLRLQAQAEDALVLLIGQPLPRDLPLPVPLRDQTIRDDLPAGLPSDLLTRRPDILQAEAVLRSDYADIGAARAAFFPRISLTGAFGSESSTLNGLFEAGSRAWTFTPSLIAPIFNAGANRAILDSVQAQRDIDIARYEKAIQTAFKEVADGIAARRTYGDQLASAERLAAAEQRRLKIAEVRYDSGVNGYLEVLTAQTDLYNAQLALTGIRVNRLASLVDLYRALGGGWVRSTSEPARTGRIDPLAS